MYVGMYYFNNMTNKITETFTNSRNTIIVRFFKFEVKFATEMVAIAENLSQNVKKRRAIN